MRRAPDTLASARPDPRRWRTCLAVAALTVGVAAGSAADAAPPDFAVWLDGLRAEARQQGVGEATLEAALANLAPVDRVLELQARQPESTQSWAQYARRVVTDDRVDRGRRLLAEHAQLLDEVARRYGVQPRFLVALWGLESDFGRHTGSTPAAAALATLAWAGRRSDYFRRELIELLLALEEGYVPRGDVRSSWAGALGQCQFMPSNFRTYAVDHDGDGRRDIWGSTPDVLASMARFLSALGWRDDETWGRPVRLPDGFDPRLAGDGARLQLSKWGELGVRCADGSPLPARGLWANLLLPDGPSGEAFLVYHDYQTLLRWNRSHHFALSVGQLSDRLR